MKSDVFYTIQSREIPAVLEKVEQFGGYAGLDGMDSMKLRLLAEELFSLTERLLIKYDSEFWVENRDRAFELHLIEWASIGKPERDKLVSVSSEGKNSMGKGVFGKIATALENFLVGSSDPVGTLYVAGVYTPEMMGEAMAGQIWSMRAYEQALSVEARESEWDGLERSILAHIADDITIGVRGDRVELAVKVAFGQ